MTPELHGLRVRALPIAKKPSIAFDKYKIRKEWYDDHLKDDPKLNEIREIMERANKTNPNVEKIQNVHHKVWELALRLSHPEQFGMTKYLPPLQSEIATGVKEGKNQTFSGPGWKKGTKSERQITWDSIKNNKEAFLIETARMSKYFIVGNPATQIAMGVIKAAFDIVDNAVDLVKDSVKSVFGAIFKPFMFKSRQVTQFHIWKYYYHECMALDMLQNSHGGLAGYSRLGWLEFPKKQKECKKSKLEYDAPDWNDQNFQEVRLAFMVDNFGGAEAEKETSSLIESSMSQSNMTFEEYLEESELGNRIQESEDDEAEEDASLLDVEEGALQESEDDTSMLEEESDEGALDSIDPDFEDDDEEVADEAESFE